MSGRDRLEVARSRQAPDTRPAIPSQAGACTVKNQTLKQHNVNRRSKACRDVVAPRGAR